MFRLLYTQPSKIFDGNTLKIVDFCDKFEETRENIGNV